MYISGRYNRDTYLVVQAFRDEYYGEEGIWLYGYEGYTETKAVENYKYRNNFNTICIKAYTEVSPIRKIF